MSIRSLFKIDITTGEITRYISDTAVAGSLIATFYSRDKLPIGVQFVAGETDVTEDVLADGAKLRIGIRRYTGIGAILAQTNTYELEDGVAETLLDLDTAEMVAYMDQLPNQENEKPAYIEFEVSTADSSRRVTIAQRACTLRCEVNMEGDDPPPAAAESAQTAGEYAAQAIAAKDDAVAARTVAQATLALTVTAKDAAVAAANSLQPGLATLVDGATVAWDVTAHPVAKLTLGGNRTLDVSNLQAGATYILFLVQDATGSRTLTWPAAVKWQDGIAPSLTTAAGKTDIFTFTSDGANLFGTYLLNF